MTIRFRKVVGGFVATALCVAGFAAPSAAILPPRHRASVPCTTDTSGLATVDFVPARTGVAVLQATSPSMITSVSGNEAETVEGYTFVKTELGVAHVITVSGPPLTDCQVNYAVDETPRNDGWTTPEAIAGLSGSVDGTTHTSTLAVAEPQPDSDAHRVVWYQWIAAATGTVEFEVEPHTGRSYFDIASDVTSVGVAIYGSADPSTPLQVAGDGTTREDRTQTGGTVNVPVTGGSEYRIAVWSAGGEGTLASAFDYTAAGWFTLTWNDTPAGPLPRIVPRSATITEGNTGTSTVNLPVTLSAASTETVTAQWNTVFLNAGNEHEAWPNGLFSSNWDYTPDSGVVTFAPGQTSANVPITIEADVLDEWDELFLVSFHHATNATIGGFGGLGFVSIADDDAMPVIIPSLGVRRASEFPFLLITGFDVQLSAPTGRTVTVEISTPFPPGPGRATSGEDYNAYNGVLTFRPFSSSVPVVHVLPDDLPEGDEIIGFVLRNPVNATIGGYYGLGSLTIVANDGG